LDVTALPDLSRTAKPFLSRTAFDFAPRPLNLSRASGNAFALTFALTFVFDFVLDSVGNLRFVGSAFGVFVTFLVYLKFQ
jgi:hypothetical protein